MSSEVVRRQLLVSVGALNLPLDRAPPESMVDRACDAARLLRNRLLREHSRITARIESLRQAEMFDQVDSEEEYADEAGSFDYQGVARPEFVFVAEMMTAEKLVVPVLIAHGLRFPATLLPQFLKLFAALLAPVPRFSENETLQKDLLRHIKDRCGTDEFFAMLVQCVAPIAEKRAKGNLQRDDVVLLEVVLTVITRLVGGAPREAEPTVGAFCRNHGLELLLVVVNQNYSKFQSFENAAVDYIGDAEEVHNSVEEAQPGEVAVSSPNDVPMDLSNTSEAPRVTDSIPTIDITDDDANNNSDEDDNGALNPLSIKEMVWDKQFKQRMQKLLESDAQLWKWNIICLETIADVLACVPAAELAQVGFITQSSTASARDVLDRLRNSQSFVDCKKERDNWRSIARSRNGAMNSNGILVRADPNRLDASAVGGRAIGTVSALLGTKRKDPLETLRDLDLRKKGRFIRGMYQDSTSHCNLPLPTKIELSQQGEAFLRLGFEPLGTMTWPSLRKDISEIERATFEYREVVAGYRSSGEKMEVTTPLDTALYEKVGNVLHYMSMCTSFLHYIREVVRLMLDEQLPFSSATFQQQWQSVSNVISLDHFDSGFIMLRCFLNCRDLRRRLDVTVVVSFLAELLLALNLLLEGVLVNDPSVEVAAHALASSVLYKEDNIKALFDLLGEYSSRSVPVQKAQALTLFTSAVFQLMEKCSYKGSLLLPKKEKKKTNAKVVTEAVNADNADDQESILSSQSDQDETGSLAEMINDEEDEAEDGMHFDELAHEDNPATPPSTTNALGNADTENTPLETAGAAAALMVTEAQTGGARRALEDLQSQSPVAEPAAIAEAADDDLSQRRAPSEASLASSRRTALSTISSEREVAVSSYIRRLATPKNMGLLYSTLRHWRTNDADINLGLTYLMNSLIKDGCECVFFNIAFLLTMREVLAHGQKTHAPLYYVCDQVVFDFFNPPYAKSQDSLAASRFSEQDLTVLRGAQSFLGFEVSLRCARSLFNFSATDYSLLEEKGMPHLMDHVVIPLPGEESTYETAAVTSRAPALRVDTVGPTAEGETTDEEDERRMVEQIAKEIERSERKKRRREEKDSGKKESKKHKKHKKERKEKRKHKRERHASNSLHNDHPADEETRPAHDAEAVEDRPDEQELVLAD